MGSEDFHTLVPRSQTQAHAEVESWRRHCGCIKTSEKLKHILESFPVPPPPTPTPGALSPVKHFNSSCVSAYCNHDHQNPARGGTLEDSCKHSDVCKKMSRPWQVVVQLVSLVQLSVTATALALYYLIYCYMQLVYYTLRTALYFHNADGAMKITIGVVTVTSLVVGFNLILRMEKLVGLLC